MQEGAAGVKRLLRTIQNADESTVKELARLLNYHEPQLKQDIESISLAEITDKEGGSKWK